MLLLPDDGHVGRPVGQLYSVQVDVQRGRLRQRRPDLVQPLHVQLELPLAPLDGLLQALDLLPQVEVLSRQPGDLVLEAGLHLVGGTLVDDLVDDLLLLAARLAQLAQLYPQLPFQLPCPSLLLRQLLLQRGDHALLRLIRREEFLRLRQLRGGTRLELAWDLLVLAERDVGEHRAQLDALLASTLELILQLVELLCKQESGDVLGNS